MNRLVKSLLACCVLLSVFAAPCLAEVSTITLAELIKYSDLVVVATVVNANVDGKRIAEIKVSKTLKGDPSLSRVRFYASPVWVCDVSDAKDNETAIFFLRRNFTDDPTELPQTSADGVPVFFITHSGRGRMVFRHVDDVDFVYANKRGEVLFPSSLPFASYPEPANRNLGLVKVAELIAYIRSHV